MSSLCPESSTQQYRLCHIKKSRRHRTVRLSKDDSRCTGSPLLKTIADFENSFIPSGNIAWTVCERMELEKFDG
jgi:hypothetical protein